MTDAEKLEAWALLDALRRQEGNSVTFCNDNADLNDLPNCAVAIVAEWTDWAESTYRADTILDCLKMAVFSADQSLDFTAQIPLNEEPTI